jgi:beta-lactamase class A
MTCTRRDLLIGSASVVLASVGVSGSGRATRATDALAERLHAIESRLGGRLGVAAIDTGSGRRVTYRGDERFPMCSTFKSLLAAHVLSRVDAGREHLDRIIPYGPADLLDYAPVTRAHVADGGMTVEALTAAAVEQSDNTAANLLLAASGGPAGLTQYVRSIGDPTTRLDRLEPTLNAAEPGDDRDTTTPVAMLRDMQLVLLDTVLARASRDRLVNWLVAGTTGATKLRAGLPTGWRVGDKTGTGAHGSNNDVAVAWPPGRAPMFIAAYSVGSPAPEAARDSALADVARLIASSPPSLRGPRRGHKIDAPAQILERR